MSVTPDDKTAYSVRFDLKPTLQQEAIIRHAAEVTQKSVSEFILESACTAAKNALTDQRFFLLDDDSWQKFMDALERPATVKPRLRKLMKEKSPWE